MDIQLQSKLDEKAGADMTGAGVFDNMGTDPDEEPVQTTGIEKLRANIEQEYRFKTVLQGYDKKAVQDYINELTALYNKRIGSLKAKKAALAEENAALTEENAALLKRLALTEKQQAETAVKEKAGEAEADTEGRHRASSKLEMQESLVARLREANQALEDENHSLQLKVRDMEAKITETYSRTRSGNLELTALNEKLSEMLGEQLDHMADIVAAWQEQYHETVQVIEDRLREE